ncbi:MAG: hypothetical protein ABI318_02890, partial [Chthoniobacteraceae bacterium]
ATDCDVLTAGVARRIREFQERGGIVVGDENLARAIRTDIRIARIARTKKGDADQSAILANAAKLRAALDARYIRPTDCTNPEIVTRLRTAGDSDYVFVVNDRREFGTYVGQHGVVMENGLPSTGDISLRRAGGHVYDLVAGREVSASVHGDRLHWSVNLAPCDGRVFLITPQPIAAVVLTAPEVASRGGKLDVSVTIADAAGKPVPAVAPVWIEITDPAGRVAEFSGHYGARDGRLDLHLEPAANDAPGVWEVRVTELASGRTARHFFRLMPKP